MTNEEYARRIGAIYEKILELRNSGDYVVNQPQMDKLVNIYKIFLEIADDSFDEVEPYFMDPKEEHGGVTAYFVVFDIYGDMVKRFTDAISECSAIGIDVAKDKVCISCTVPNCFVPWTEKQSE